MGKGTMEETFPVDRDYDQLERGQKSITTRPQVVKKRDQKRKHRSSKPIVDKDAPLTEIRKKVRSLEKLLVHDGEMAKASLNSAINPGVKSMPSHIRQEKERALAGYKHDLELALEKQTRTKQHSKMISKYHAVRFYERKKAARHLKKQMTLLGDGEGSEEAVLRSQTDYYYTLFLPLSETYVSLWPKGRGEDPDKVRDGPSWQTIQEFVVRARRKGLSEPEMEEQLLKLRDTGWSRKFRPDSLSMTSDAQEDAASRPKRAGVGRTAQQISKVKTTSPLGNAFTLNVEGDEMNEDSDGFFER